MDNIYMNLEQCAQYTGLAAGTIRKMAAPKVASIPVRRHGSKLMFYRPDIDAWSASRAQPVKEVSKSRFQSVRERLRSLTTETTAPPSGLRKGA